MPTHQRTRCLTVGPRRTHRARRVLRPVAGQCFEIEVRPDGDRWMIAIPEINAAAQAPTRAAVEQAARELIAARTGIPLGYISVWARD